MSVLLTHSLAPIWIWLAIGTSGTIIEQRRPPELLWMTNSYRGLIPRGIGMVRYAGSSLLAYDGTHDIMWWRYVKEHMVACYKGTAACSVWERESQGYLVDTRTQLLACGPARIASQTAYCIREPAEEWKQTSGVDNDFFNSMKEITTLVWSDLIFKWSIFGLSKDFANAVPVVVYSLWLRR